MLDASGLLVIHLWVESGDRVRARVTHTDDVTSGGATVMSYAATPTEVLALTQRWLDALVTRR